MEFDLETYSYTLHLEILFYSEFYNNCEKKNFALENTIIQ